MFKKIIVLSLISLVSLNASMLNSIIDSTTKIMIEKIENQNESYNKSSNSNYKKNKKQSMDLNFESKIERENVNITKSSLFIKRYINYESCNQILDNSGYFTTCYDYELKSAIKGYVKLDGNLVNELNIEKRPKFYDDLELPKEYRTKSSDYARSGFDQGHSVGSDASFDYSLKSQKATYVMSNVVPQYPNTNRLSYLNVENYERLVAKTFGESESLVFNFFDRKPKRLGKTQFAIPNGFAKIVWNEENKFQRCFYIPNDDVAYELQDLEISCKELTNKL